MKTYLVTYSVTVERIVKVEAPNEHTAKALAQEATDIVEEFDQSITFDILDVYEDED